MTENFKTRLRKVKEKIKLAAEKSKRRVEEIKLVAVSKTHPPEILREAVQAGINVFGENKIQEAESKILEIGRENAEWHLIGHLQSNKARKAVKLFDVIHSIDSVELAERLERICKEENRNNLAVFAQVDLAREETKSGISERDLPDLVEFLKACEYLKFEGFMILPPFFEEAEKVRPFFRRLREIRDEHFHGGGLSMGMSHDFEIGVEEGATIVRIGTAIFGERIYQSAKF